MSPYELRVEKLQNKGKFQPRGIKEMRNISIGFG